MPTVGLSKGGLAANDPIADLSAKIALLRKDSAASLALESRVESAQSAQMLRSNREDYGCPELRVGSAEHW